MSLFRHTDAEGDLLEVDEGTLAITVKDWTPNDPVTGLKSRGCREVMVTLPEEDVEVGKLISAILVATGKTILAVGESSVVVVDA